VSQTPGRRANLFRARSLGGLLATCFKLYAHHFLLFATLALTAVVPVEIALYGLGGGWLWSGYDNDLSLVVDFLDVFVPILVITPLITATHVLAVAEINEGRVPSAGATIKDAARLFWPVLGVVALSTLGIILGLILLIVPGIYLMVRWYVPVQAAVLEGGRGGAALRRSGELIDGSWWRVAGIALVLLVVSYALRAPGTYLLEGRLAEELDSGLVQLTGRIVSDAVGFSFGALSGTVLYFDLRARALGEGPS
jgi:hypothetical protein